MLVLHGLMDAGATWKRVAASLADRGHLVVVPDLRGFGSSDRVGAGGYYHFPDYVADVARLVDSLAPERLAVVGHSMGGTVAVYFTGARLERVEKLALIEGIGPPSMPASLAPDRMGAWLRDLRRVERSPRPVASIEAAIERLAQTYPRIDRAILATVAPDLVHRDADGGLRWAFDPLHRTTAPFPFDEERFRGFLGRIRCPSLFVSGGDQGFHPSEEAERLALLRARFVALDEARSARRHRRRFSRRDPVHPSRCPVDVNIYKRQLDLRVRNGNLPPPRKRIGHLSSVVEQRFRKP